MDHITRPACSLKTLGVIIDLADGGGADFQYNSLRRLAQSKNLIDLLANVSVESRIHLLVRSDTRTGLQFFNDFATEVAQQRRWTVSTMKCVIASENGKIVGRNIGTTNEAFEDETGNDEAESPTSFQKDITESNADRRNWVWTLQPRHC